MAMRTAAWNTRRSCVTWTFLKHNNSPYLAVWSAAGENELNIRHKLTDGLVELPLEPFHYGVQKRPQLLEGSGLVRLRAGKRLNTQTGLKMGLMLPWKQWTLTEGLEFAETTSTSAVRRRRRIYWHCWWWQRGDSETTRAKEFDPPKKHARLTSMCWDIWRNMASSLLCSCQIKHSWLILYTQKVHSHGLLFLPTNTIYTWR